MATIPPPPPGSTVIPEPPPGSTAIGESENTPGAPSSDIPPEMWKQFGWGALQGLLGPGEAIYQAGEKAGVLPAPPKNAVTDWLRNLRDTSDATWPGVIGEAAGAVPAFMAGGEALDALGVTGKVGSMLPEWLSPATRTALTTGAESTIAQPSRAKNIPDYLTEKGEQFGLGAILGRLLGRPTQQAQHDVSQQAADVVAKQNEAAQAAHEQTAATEKEQHQALTEAELTYRRGEREKAQVATRELSRRKDAAVDALGVRREAKRDIPAQTTTGWWQRTGARIGETVPTDATADTGAHVQNAVGGRINALTGRMTLEPDNASLNDQLAEIRRRTKLEPRNQDAFYKEEQQTPLQGRIYDAQGKLMPPIAGAPAPKVSGRWKELVLDPLKKPLTGKALSDYISSLTDEANTLATSARRSAPGTPERADLLAQADAYRQAQDAAMGHAAGTDGEAKLEWEKARQAYMMWGVGNDAAKASRGGVARPSELISMMVKRLGEARYKQALIDPKSPFHDELNWLQGQQTAISERLPSERQTRSALGRAPDIPSARPAIPIPKPSSRAEPRPLPVPDVVPAPKRAGRDYLRAGEHATIAYLLRHDPVFAGWQLRNVISALRKRGNVPEGGLEAAVRKVLTNRPRLQRAARGAAAGTAAQVPKNTDEEIRNLPSMFYRWGSGQ